ncbi:hypothetical protein [Fangia hongkongensis]|uniref:hypothetical protein n=1 Tax=Fangia hongkongensis TaxID=270495 RepID=UPI00036E108E|nr:hypothetical protein [Fangia hongkongensis]MBK2125659.1 hypothetical protein [Fangia hongkongensis]
MDNFLTLRNFTLAFSAMLGVILFVVTCIRLIGTESGSSAKVYSKGQIAWMFFISMVLVSLVNFMDVGSVTLFQGNAFTVAAADPWLNQSNLANILSQMHLVGEDVDTAARLWSYFMMGMKLLGLALFVWITAKWYESVQGTSNTSASMIVIFYLLSFVFWNFGVVIQLVANTFNYEITI